MLLFILTTMLLSLPAVVNSDTIHWVITKKDTAGREFDISIAEYNGNSYRTAVLNSIVDNLQVI